MRWIVVLIPILSVGCALDIRVGTECPEFEGPCPRISEVDGEADDDSGGNELDATLGDANASDGGTPDAGDASPDLDAQPPLDAGHDALNAPDTGNQGDAEVALFPGIRNASFELPPDASAPLTLDALNLAGAEWRGCRSEMQLVSEATTRNGTVVNRTDGSTFYSDGLSADFVQAGLVQQLTEPLKAGQLYALELDVWAEQGEAPGGMTYDVALKLGSGLLPSNPLEPLDCILSNFTELDTTGPITPGGWQTFCLSFRPQREASSITLLGSVSRDLLRLTGAQLFVDNIRPVARCP